MASQQKHWPTWIVVIAVIILAGPAIWLLSIVIDFIWAFGIVGILAVAAIVGTFIWVKGRVDADRVA